MKKYELKAVELDEVSLVDSPASPGAKVILFKRNGGTTANPEEGVDNTPPPEPVLEGVPEELQSRVLKLRMDLLWAKIQKSNPCHTPSGPKGGQFCETGGGKGGVAGAGGGVSGYLRNAMSDSRRAERIEQKLKGNPSNIGLRNQAIRAHRSASTSYSLAGDRENAHWHLEQANSHASRLAHVRSTR